MSEKRNNFDRPANEENAPGDAVVERHLAEMHAAYAALDSDPDTAAQLDAAIVAAERELTSAEEGQLAPRQVVDPGAALRLQRKLDEVDALQVRQREELQKLQEARSLLDVPPKRRSIKAWHRHSGSFVPSLVTSLSMIAATVLLAIFGNFAYLGAILPILVSTPAVIALLGSYAYFDIIRRSSRSGEDAKYAYRTLKLLQQDHSKELREIAAKEAVATAALRSSPPLSRTTLELGEWRLETRLSEAGRVRQDQT